MTVRFNGTGDGIRLSTSSPPSMTALTVVWWRKVVTQNDSTSRTELFIERTGDFATARHTVTGTNVNQWGAPGGSAGSFSPSEPEDNGTWVMFAHVCNGTGSNGSQLYSWASGAADGSYKLAQSTHSGGATINIWGIGDYGGEYRDGEYCFVKIWGAALSLSELQAERIQGKPVRTSNVWAYHRLSSSSDSSDGSGNGRTLTFQGSVANGVDSEPVPWEVVAVTGSGAPASSSSTLAGFGGITSPVLKPFISPVTSVKCSPTSVSGTGTLG